MRLPWVAAAILCLATGCAALPPAPGSCRNPAFIAIGDREIVHSVVVDVVDDYFQIDREERVKLIGDVLTEGRIETFPEVGATFLEPWRGDSANPTERLESTLQTIRRRASVRIIPSGGGYLLDVSVFKELEDLPRPEHATAGAATLRNDASLDRYQEPVGGQPPTLGWIPLGRDAALEREIISKVLARTNGMPLRRWPAWPF